MFSTYTIYSLHTHLVTDTHFDYQHVCFLYSCIISLYIEDAMSRSSIRNNVCFNFNFIGSVGVGSSFSINCLKFETGDCVL